MDGTPSMIMTLTGSAAKCTAFSVWFIVVQPWFGRSEEARTGLGSTEIFSDLGLFRCR